jgi:non-specific serine/threonine protein kinase
MARSIPRVQDGMLRLADGARSVRVGAPAWFTWLTGATAFAFAGPDGGFTARHEAVGHGRGGRYWKAYRRSGGRLHRAYLGRSEDLTPERLAAAAAALAARAAAAGDGRPRETPRAAPRRAHRPPAPPAPALPAALTRFVGRERELAALLARLPTARLLTLTGAGGCGKTRLAVEAARQVVADYPDGVWPVELGPLADPALVPQAVARALGLRERPGRPLPALLAEALRPRRAILLLDNCERLAPACAELATTLLEVCPDLRVLATSRAPLGVAGEVVWRVPPLGLPPSGTPPSAAWADASEAVQLFLDRARAAQPAFALTDDNAAAVAAICGQLDGLPLAIELAAARLSVLSAEQLAARLADRFALLTTGRQAALPHHRTLRAAVEWSYELLDAADQAAFARLAVFAGGFTLEAAEAVCAGEGDGECLFIPPSDDACAPVALLDALGRLVDRSLVVVEPERAAGPRYRLLETLRAFAWERLAADGAADLAGRRHAAFFAAWAEARAAERPDGERSDWLDRLEEEHDNLRAALGWAQARGERALAVRLTGVLFRFWLLQGHFGEGCRWLDGSLRLIGPAATPERAGLLLGAAECANAVGEFARARGWLDEALALAEALDDRRIRARGLRERSYGAFMTGDYAAAVADNEAAVTLARPLGDPLETGRLLMRLAAKVWAAGDAARAEAVLAEARRLLTEAGSAADVAVTLSEAGHLALAGGDHARARACYAESVALLRAGGGAARLAGPLAGLGAAALAEGDLGEAARRHREALELRRGHGDRAGVSLSLDGLAALAAARGQPAAAARLHAAAAALRAALGMPVPFFPAFGVLVDRQVAALRRRLGAAAFDAAWAAGAALGVEAAVADALAVADAALAAPSPGGRPPGDGLSGREREVVALLAQGRSNRAIAAALALSERTIEGHVSRALGKLGLTTRAQLAVWAVRRGLVDPEDAAPAR